MQDPLRIAFIASECDPFVKTGGLADVISSLPKALKQLGHNPLIILPRYASLNMGDLRFRKVFTTLGVWMGNCLEWCSVYCVDYDQIPVYFIDFDKYFKRDNVYHDSDFKDFSDNAFRFGFFTRAALQLLIDMRIKTDIIHVHDWQTALGTAYQKIWHWNNEFLGAAGSVLTVHNIAYQGVYSSDCYDYLGLQWSNFTSDKFEDHGRVNFLKGGIQYAGAVTTVSRKYAEETKTPEYAFGLAPYLNDKGDRYRGILNGVDYTIWNPEIDPLIPATYSRSDPGGKTICKRKLQERMGLKLDLTIPVFGVISRFVSQKGLHLLAEVLRGVIHSMHLQFVILGSGEPYLEAFFKESAAQYPDRIATYIGYHNELAHWIEAGADCFLMPSLYEPCGLNQIYSLKYGTLPVVRATGGLDDSVTQYSERDGSGTGFKFYEPTSQALADTIGWAVSTWYDRPSHFASLRDAAMSCNFSWDISAAEYLEVYRQTLSCR